MYVKPAPFEEDVPSNEAFGLLQSIIPEAVAFAIGGVLLEVITAELVVLQPFVAFVIVTLYVPP